MRLVVIAGPMFSEKNSRLISEGERYANAGRKVLYLKPETDEGWNEKEVLTANGVSIPACVLKNTLDIEKVHETDVILINEVQFIPIYLIKQIKELVRQGKTVIAAGLDMDYLSNSFPVTRELMCQADEVIKLKGQCRCGETAVMSSISKEYRMDMLNPVVLGNEEKYTAMCRQCYYEENAEI